MPETPDSDLREAKTEKARRRWLGRWLLKLFGWFFAMAIVVVVIIAIVATIAWYNITGVANAVVARFVQPYRIELGKVDVSKRGEVHLEAVKFFPPESLADPEGAPWVDLDGVDLTYDLEELRNEKRFRTVTLRNPKIRIDDGSLELLGGGTKSKGGEEGQTAIGIPDLGFLGKIADRIEVTGGSLVIDTSVAPLIATRWDLSVPAVDFGGEEWLNLEPLALRLKDVRLGEKGVLGTIKQLDARARLLSNLGGIEVAELAIISPKLMLSPDWLPETAASDDIAAGESPLDGEVNELPLSDEAREAFEILVDVFRVADGEISLKGFDGKDGRTPIPNLAFASSIDWRDLRIAGGDISAGKPLSLAMDDIILDGTAKTGGDQPPTAKVGNISLGFDLGELIDRRRIESITVTAPKLFLTPESTERFFPGEAEKTEEGTVPPSDNSEKRISESVEWSVGSLVVKEGSVEAQDWLWNDRKLPRATFDWGVELSELSPGVLVSEFSSPDVDPEQHLTLENLEIVKRAGEGSLIAIESLATRFRIQALQSEHRLDTLMVKRPRINLTDERLPDWVADFEPDPATEEGTPTMVEPGATEESLAGRVPFSVGDVAIENGAIRLDTAALDNRLPKLQGTFSLGNREETEVSENKNPYRLNLGRLRVRSRQGAAMTVNEMANSESDEAAAAEVAVSEVLGGLFPQDPDPEESNSERMTTGESGAIREQDVAFIRNLTIDFSAEGLQRDRRVDRIEVKGAEFQLGKGLQEMVDGGGGDTSKEEDSPEDKGESGVGPQAAAAPEPNDEGWRVGEFVVTESQVRFESLIPQIEGLEFGIETRLDDVPLSKKGLLSQEAEQKVELAGIEIRDPYDSFITVAFLPTIFVEFTFAGLIHQRVEKIDLINPAIYVGQGLFWWIDYQRNYRKQNEGTGFGFEGKAEDGNAALVFDEGAEGDAGVDWEIRQINAHFGKLVVAPTGRPIGIVPFPFHASRNMNEGQIEMKLEIPKEEQYVYQFPDLELDLFGLEGKIEFNIPIKQEDNNLVQTFELARALWKQYEVEKLYLTVTYDSDGIYGKFGGEAYGGYAEGQFNVYLDDVGVWDAWIAGTNLDMEPITNVVAPDSFIMAGKINAKLVSEGRGLLFGETWGEIEALSPGRIDFTKLNEFIADLPEEWSSMKRSATQLSLEALKDFEYETGRGDLYFVNRDGWLRLDLEGETGSRVLEMYAHDWRKDQGDTAQTEESETNDEIEDTEADKPHQPEPKSEDVAESELDEKKILKATVAESRRAKPFRSGLRPGRR